MGTTFSEGVLGVGDTQYKTIVMTQLMKNQPSQWWWLESHSTTKRSPWFQSTLNGIYFLPLINLV
ncbi:hypothetical protein Lal_00011647 [Lupinus albus]|nr:hypothetical protein Lal_00011647 [Lupinus albus]